MNEKIVKDENGKIKKNELQREFNEWYKTNFQEKPPKRQELFERVDTHFGAFKNNCWRNIRLCYDDDSDDDNL